MSTFPESQYELSLSRLEFADWLFSLEPEAHPCNDERKLCPIGEWLLTKYPHCSIYVGFNSWACTPRSWRELAERGRGNGDQNPAWARAFIRKVDDGTKKGWPVYTAQELLRILESIP